MKKPTSRAIAPPVQYVPCVLKLDKRKFACYVEEHIDSVPPLGMDANAVKIFPKRKKAWRAALAMALARARSAGRISGKLGKQLIPKGSKSSKNILA